MTGVRESSPYRLLSLAAVCLQSTALAIILHVSQANLKPGQVQYKASSAVLITEIGKLVLSLLLALRDAWKERATLHAPRHNLPSPELYAMADEVHQKDVYADDPFDTTPQLMVNGQAPGLQSSNNLRRRSSAMAPSDTLSVQMDGGKGGKLKRFPENSTLSTFQWPRAPLSPVVQEKDGLPGSPELVKMLTDPVLWTRRRRMGLRAMLWEDIFGSDWWKMGIPAVLFAVQNNLIYVAARNLSVPVFQITFQLKTLITAMCAVAMLGRRLTITQWFSLLMLGAGVATMQLGAIHAKAADSHDHGPVPVTETASYLTGVSAVLISCFSSAIAATYFELVIKKKPVVPEVQEFLLVAPPDIKPTSLWVRNIQLSLFSTLFGIIVVLVQANPGHIMGYGGLSLDFKGMVDPLEHWYDPVMTAAQGFFDGFHPMVWFVIALQTVGGLLIALAIKYADNVAKGFALSISIVFTFLLSVILFDFKLTIPSTLGGLAVVGSTLLYEADDKFLRQLLRPDPYSPSKPLLRRWHYFLLVILATTFGVAVIPSRHLSVTDAAWDLVAEHSAASHGISHLPTIAIADMGPINALMTKAAGVGDGACGWGLSPNRYSNKAPYGGNHPVPSDYPYYVANTNQYALDDILTSRMIDYARNVPLLSTPSPNFIFLPVLSQIWSNPWGCQVPDLAEGIRQTTEYLRQIVASVGPTDYPRIILPVAGIRSNLEAQILTPEIMEELKDSVIIVSIESAPKTYQEGLKYLIDVPYPTSFHLSLSQSGAKPGSGDYWLNQNRHSLLHYAAAASHPWGLPASDPFNGFALRNVLHKEFSAYTNSPPPDATSTIIFDDITNSFDGAQNLTAFHEHMAQSIFCPQPAGDSPTRRAIYEAMLLGCIPVIFREKSYGRLFPSSPEINDMSRYTVYVDENEMINGVGPTLIQRLEQITPREIHRMQRHIAKIASKLQWSIPEEELYYPLSAHSQNAQPLPEGIPMYNHTISLQQQAEEIPIVDAFTVLLKELETIRSGEWVAGVARDHRKGMKPKAFGKQGQRG